MVFTMKIAISSTGQDMSADVDPRFGRAAYLCIFDTSKNEMLEVIDNSESKNASQGAGITVAGLVASKGVETILTGRVGPKAMAVVEKANIKVVSGVSGSVEQTIAAFVASPSSQSQGADSAPNNCRRAGGQGRGLGQGQGRNRQGQNCSR